MFPIACLGLFGDAVTIDANVTAAEPTPAVVVPVLSAAKGQTLLREEILKTNMRPENGYGYAARLHLGRPGDRDGEASQCQLLEDGKPLAQAHALHAAIRKQGGGRYSHWTASQLYFSASDSSDPRTNGRKYELVSDRQYVRKTAEVHTSAEWSTFSIKLDDDKRVQPTQVVLRNLNEKQAVIARLARKGDPDLTSAASMVASITNDRMTDEQRAVAIWQFLVDWRYHDYPAEERGEVHDPVKLINVYGYGFCDDSAAAFCQLANTAGLKSRSYGLSGHVVAEAFYDNAWHMFDPDHQVVYRTKTGKIASVAELEDNPRLITRTARDPLGLPSERMAELYTTRGDNRPYQAVAAARPAVMQPIIGPGDSVVFDFNDRRRVHRRTQRDQPLPSSYANGTLIQQLQNPQRHDDGPQVLQVRWPYVILGGQLVVAENESARNLAVSISADGETFTPLSAAMTNETTTVSLDAWVDQQPTAIYGYWLKIEGAQGRLSTPKQTGTLHTTFQFAPRALATIKPGGNEFELYVQSTDDKTLSVAETGMELKLVWEELRGE